MSIKLIDKFLKGFVADHEIEYLSPAANNAYETLMKKNGPGNAFLGWVDLPKNYDRDEVAQIKKAAAKICDLCDVLVVIGIGGSYLGARAAIEFIHGNYYNNKKKNTPDIYFVGKDISSSHLQDILDIESLKFFLSKLFAPP